MTENDRQPPLETGMGRVVDHPTDRCVHELVAQQVGRTPDAIAVQIGDECLTYRELDARSSGLAYRLRTLGVGPEVIVALYLERSLEMVVAILGVLKAGAAYLPLDTAEPSSRLEFKLTDSGAAIAITLETLVERLPVRDGVRVLCLDSESETTAGDCERPPRSGVSPDSLAYVIYTSGSTGKPKGVLVCHRSVVNQLSWMRREFRPTASDRFLQWTPYSFDASVWDLFLPLMVGASVVLTAPGRHADPAYLVETIKGRSITVLHAVPSLLPTLLDQPEFSSCLTVRHVFVGGEPLPSRLVARLVRTLDAKVHNLYGPTEATIDTTFHTCTGEGENTIVPIGRPIDNVVLRVLDDSGAPVPVGQVGELYIGGAGLARGYLNRPDLDAERFVPDPLGDDPDARLYRSGDEVRYSATGELEFLGRRDHQVKLRGFRIELGEIESALLDHPGVRECVVLLREDAPTRKRLVAYFITDPAELDSRSEEPLVQQMRNFLAARLPAYMVPAAFVLLDALPRSVQGKVDRQALLPPPEPESERDDSTGGEGSPLERELGGIWRRVLGVGEIGLDDSFFDLGGDSLQGATVTNELQQRLGEVVYISAIFDAPTVARQAVYLEEHYPETVAKLYAPAEEEPQLQVGQFPPPVGRMGGEQLEQLRDLVGTVGDGSRIGPVTANRRAVFILSPPRSGSTLLRVMLAGHPELFSPPELDLLEFESLQERRAACTGRNAFRLEGALRAIMEIRGCDADDAKQIMEDCEKRGLTVPEFYGVLQDWIGDDRVLADKTPTYTYDVNVLRRAESYFAEPVYLHLVRHPCGMTHSFAQARTDRIFRYQNAFSPSQLAELVWNLSHENILRFLEDVPSQRHLLVRFEELVKSPRAVLESICRLVGIEMRAELLDPYGDKSQRMSDGLHPTSRVIGDLKFHEHSGVDPAVADRWRGHVDPESLGDMTRTLARTLGFADLPARQPSPDVEKLSADEVRALLLDKLSVEEQRALLEQKMRGESAARHSYPLSFAQQRLWLVDQLGAGSAYNITYAVPLRGRLDTDALERSIHATVERHDALRAKIVEEDGVPVQVFAPGRFESLPIVDLTRTPESDQPSELRRAIREFARRRFDLGIGRLLRTCLVRLSGDDHVLVVAVHHIAFDATSRRVFFRELADCYRAFASGRRPSLPELRETFGDYAVSQSQASLGDFQEQLTYWKSRLGDLPVLNLPLDHARPALPADDAETFLFDLPDELTEQVKQVGRSHGVTSTTVLQAAFGALLSRYTGQDDIAFGMAASNRHGKGMEQLIGQFVNLVVLRTDHGGEPTFSDLLQRYRQTSLEAYRHQDIPFEMLVQELQPDRARSGIPLFQVAFGVVSDDQEMVRMPGLEVGTVEHWRVATQFDLELQLREQSGKWTGRLVYATGLFDEPTIERLVDHLRALLAGAVSNPQARISDLPLLTETERHALAEWNSASRSYPVEGCLHELFERQVERNPGAVAITFEDRSSTYSELNARANRLAHLLRARGVGPDVLVGLHVKRTAELLVGILGILKAGGAYVPLDTSNPPDRIEFILQDTDVRVLVTESDLLEALREHIPSTVCLDRDSELIEQQSDENPVSGSRPGNLAYVIYTSGSTGKPKGVLVEHASVARLFTATEEWFEFGPSDVWTLFHSFAFDFSVWEIWGALLYGGKLVVVPYWVSRSPEEFFRLLAREGVTVLNQTPSAFRQLMAVDEALPDPPELALRYVIFGGEALNLKSLRSWFDRHGDERPRLVNMYGITETTVHVTYRPLTAADAKQAAGSRIGVPIPDLQAWVLDRKMQPAAFGVPGELFIGGAGVARGYLGRPELTASRFVMDPFAPGSGARLYRTGDAARYRADGDIEYLGRLDLQVKIRGFRIELGEIESALASMDGVGQVAVIARQQAEETQLVAYVVAALDRQPSPRELRDHLLQRLPDYMVPSAFVFLDSLPLTPNGKLDTKALPAPTQTQLEAEYVAPRDGLEEVIRDIWADLLEVERIGVHDNFFELGGHSLLAVQVLARVRTVLHTDISLAPMFEDPTVAGLAEHVRRARGTEPTAPPMVRDTGREHYPLSFAQQRLWFLDQIGAGAAYNIVTGLELCGNLDIGALEMSIRGVVERHEVLRSRVITVSGEPRQITDLASSSDLQRLDLSGLAEQERRAELVRFVSEESRRPFSLSTGPPFRATLIRLGEQEYAFVFSAHHIVFDGWSAAVLLRELETHYRSFVEGTLLELPELPVQYADYSAWQRNWLQGDTLDRQLEYWEDRLGGLATLELPTDHTRPSRITYDGASVDFEIPAEWFRSLRELCKAHSVTLAMTLQAAFVTLLHRYTGQDDIVIGCPIANRSYDEITDLVGFFVNMLVMRTDVSDAPSFIELLHRVRDVSLGAYDHQDVPFEQLVERLDPERDQSRNPLFQVVFAMQTAPAEPEFPGLKSSPLSRRSSSTTRFDIEMHIRDDNSELSGRVVYNTRLFERSTIERLAEHYRNLVERLIADPLEPVTALPITGAEERAGLLELGVGRTNEYPRERCVHELFEARAAETPDRLAVVDQDEHLTYAELDSLSNRIAHCLRKRGVGPAVPVGLHLARSARAVATMLGVLKAGGTFVPLDPAYPRERLSIMLDDAAAPVLVTRSDIAGELHGYGGDRVLLDADWPEILAQPHTRLSAGTTADSLAYVIYTSGSTGRPNGVCVPHRGIVRLVQNTDYVELGRDEVILQFAPLSFDASTFEVWGSLLNGGKLVVLQNPTPSLDELGRAIVEHGITTLWLTAALFRHMVDAQPERLRSVRQLLAGGEALSAPHVSRWLASLDDGQRLINGYGPTENTTFTCCHVMDRHTAIGRSVPIGRPIANTRVYVLDKAMNPQPVGIPGELFIGGDGLASGYLNAPELNARRFVPYPFDSETDARLYRSGDRCRWLPDGTLEFLGRFDDQVKIRGFRIEPGEIETVLQRLPEVREAIVLARGVPSGERSLVAYVVASGEGRLDPEDLKKELGSRIPGYMVPSAIVVLDALPLNANGKVDRNALPDPTASVASDYVEPRDATEAAIAEIWSEHLGVDRVGIHDDFFDLGGHSLAAMRVLGRVRDRFRVDVAISHVFDSPTVAELAQIVEVLRASCSESDGPSTDDGADEFEI